MKKEFRFHRTPDRSGERIENRETMAGGRVSQPMPGVTSAGGLTAGKSQRINTDAQRDYWQGQYNREPYYESGRSWDDYSAAYRTGYEGCQRNGGQRNWEQCEEELRRDFEKNKGSSKLSWTQARPAARAAWDRVDRNFESYIGHHVVDSNEEVIGKLSSLWTDDTGEPAYLGVKTSWFSGKHHVIPAHSAQLDSRRERIRVSFTEDVVKDAPAFDPEEEFGDADERRIEEYYARYGHQAAETAARSTGTMAKGTEAKATEKRSMKPGEEGASVTLSEEEVKVGKREVVAGGVRLRKVVKTETVNQPVELKHEEIVVERVPASEATASSKAAFEQKEVFVPLRREEPVIEKEAHVREEVRLRKEAHAERQNISAQVRREDVEIQKEGEARETERTGARQPR
jgi:uncharacterized protein (TIGR02271 family)